MANVKKVNSHKSASSKHEKTSKVDKLKSLIIGFDNDKITELVLSDQKSPKSDEEFEYPEDPKFVKNKAQDTVVLKDSLFHREIQLTKNRLLNKDGNLKHKNKDNLKLCNNILMNELMINTRKDNDTEASQNKFNNNDTGTSNQNKSKSTKDAKKNNKKRKISKDDEGSDNVIKIKKKKSETSVESDDVSDIPHLSAKRRITKKGLFICDICCKQFDTKCSTRRHMYIHLYGKMRRFPCNKCKKVFSKSLYLQAHITRSHPDWEQHYMCSVCNQNFLLKENLAVHMATHSKSDSMFKCFYCRQKFSQQHKLIAHEQKHLVNGRYNCLVCEQSFDNRNKLALHFKDHLRVKDYICQHCGKEFARMNSMRRHVLVSHERQRIECTICKKVLKGHLAEHMRIHENHKPHKCDQCGHSFAQSSQLTVHKRCHSGVRPYSCRICSTSFSHSNALMLHIRRHTGEKPFECAMCPIAFSQLPHMKSHMQKIHGIDNPYKCNKCTKFFKLKVELESHLKKCKEETKEGIQVEVEKEAESAISLSRMRFLLALLLTMIATKEKLKCLGFNKRPIDDLLVDSIVAMGHVPCKDISLSPLKRLNKNIEILLKSTVPKEKMKIFRKQQKSTEDILELLTDEKK